MLGFLFSKFPLNYISLWYHRKEGFDFFKGGGRLRIFWKNFPTVAQISQKIKKNVNYSNNDNDNAVYLLTNFKLSPICKLKTFHEYKALISIKFANKGSIIRKTS